MKMYFSQNDEERFVLFLSIRGVLLPKDKEKHGKRHEIKKEDAQNFLNSVAKKTVVESVCRMNYWDVAAAYLDWEPEAVSNLKKILETRYRSIEVVVAMAPKATITFDGIKVLFALHGLDEYVTDMCRFTDTESRSVSEYLEEHPLLKNYVFLSAENHLRWFAGHAVLCESPWLYTYTANQVERIFKNGFWWDYRPL